MRNKALCKWGVACCVMLAPFAGVRAQGQTTQVHGIVSDQSGETLPGATVILKGSSKNGTVTDLNGNFTLNAKVGDVLVVTFVGYDSREVKVTSGDKSLRVILSDNAKSLDQVVVVGYGVQKKSVMSSAVSKLTGEQLDFGNPTSMSNALKGKVTGVMITSNSGQPGAGSKIRIRGVGTVNNSEPLYIVDGLPSENGIDNLNPSDIESVEVLKDAASAAIYGARGANGVVLVTTKKGSKGKVQVNYEFTFGIQNPDKKLDLLKSDDYQMLINEMATNSGKAPYFSTKSNVDTDWQEVVRNKNAPIVNHKFNVSGGTDKSNFYVSAGYLSQQGIFGKGYSDYSRLNFRLNYNTTLLDTNTRVWLNKVRLGAIVSFSRATTKGTSIGNSEVGGLMASIDMLPPTESVYQTDEDKLKQYASTYPNHVLAPDGRAYNIIEMREIVNPLADLQVNHNQRTIPINHTYNFNLEVELLKGLKYRGTFGLDYYNTTTRGVVPVYELNATSKNSTSKVQNDKSDAEFWQQENVLSYNNSFGKHNLGVLLGMSLSSRHSEYLGGADFDLLSTDINKAYIGTATAPEEQSQIWGGSSDHKLASLFARVNYNYDERYLLEAVVRRDGSSNFSTEHQYATFPSVSFGWVFTREKFLGKLPKWFDYGKVRLSWGQNGNENIGAFQYTTMMTQGKNAVFGGKVYTGMLPAGYSNKDLKWETSEQTDLGLDLRFLSGALTFSADYYVKKTKNMLLSMPIPLYTSYSTMTVNAGSVKNSGVEMELSYRKRISDLSLAFTANASYLKNEVTDQGNDRMGIDGITGGMGGQVTYSENGHPYGFFYGYKTEGVFQNEQDIANHAKQDGAKPGDLKFKDLDGDKVITANDRCQIGNPIPDWTYGFNVNSEWRGIDFTAFFQGTIGNDIYKLYRRSNVALGNFESFWLGRWHGEGTSNTVPRIVEGDNNNYQISDFFVKDGSYLRLKVAQLGYTLPRSLTSKWGIQRLRLFIQGENLFTITGYDGYDPEVGTRNGLDSGTYPQSRTFTFGASITL